MSRVNISEPLPLAHLARIESVPGVEGVGFYNFFAGYYQEPTQPASASAPSTSSAWTSTVPGARHLKDELRRRDAHARATAR